MMLATASMRRRGGGICGGKIRWMTAADVQPACDIAQQQRREQSVSRQDPPRSQGW
ncbi:hypothetical protein [Rosistilla oblonga]|uniref:hypothetical protein n=1 Tax=Rosistilla oblonga TaxID=2527990 RepID=UPI0018D22F62|nr:hypothetical protein [Rosistilla oblonga]